MELKDFIRESLVDICSAVDESKKSLQDIGIESYKIGSEGSQTERIRDIKFDIAVTTSSSNKDSSTIKGNANGKIRVLGIEAGFAGSKGNETKEQDSKVSRIQFTVPVKVIGANAKDNR